MLPFMSRDENPTARNPENEWFWGTDLLQALPPGVDLTQLEERLKLTPTERLERMRQFLEFLEGAKRQGGDRL